VIELRRSVRAFIFAWSDYF